MELPSLYQEIIHRSRYSRYLPEQQRRETWENTVDRYINFMYQTAKNTSISPEDLHELHKLLGATCEE